MSSCFSINYNKASDACSIVWEASQYSVFELEPYICAIQCDDGEKFHDLIHRDFLDGDGADDFELIGLRDFQALEGDAECEYLLCYTAVVSIDLESHPEFAAALKKSDNQIIARLQFQLNGSPILDDEGHPIHLFEPLSDNYVQLLPE